MSSEEPPIDPVESAVRGATKATLDWSSEKIKQLVTRFRNRKLAFIEDNETIETAKEQRETSEWKIFIVNIEDKELHILFQMGLTLRKLEVQKKKQKIIELNKRILDRYKPRGLHIANFVQNGIFSKYVASLYEQSVTPVEFKSAIINLFNDIEEIVVFVKSYDNVDQKIIEISTRIMANQHKTFIISSAGSAMDRCEKIKKGILKKISGYKLESYETENRKIYFLNKKEI